MTASALLHHVFPWEIAPGVARDDGVAPAAEPGPSAEAAASAGEDEDAG